MHVTLFNGSDKTGALDQARAEIVTQIRDRADQQAQADHDPTHIPHSRREIDAELAAQARVSVGLVVQARRLVRSGSEGLIVAALLGLLPVGTALRGATPPKPNAKYTRWRHIVALAGGGQ